MKKQDVIAFFDRCAPTWDAEMIKSDSIINTILSNAEPVYVPLIPPSFRFDANVLEDAFRQDRVKAMILCNPSNPCGKVFTREELQIIADLAIRYDIYVITDEVYEHITYAPHRHCYLSTLPGMRERTYSPFAFPLPCPASLLS